MEGDQGKLQDNIKKESEVNELPLTLIYDKTQWCWLIDSQSHLVGKDVVHVVLVHMPKNVSKRTLS